MTKLAFIHPFIYRNPRGMDRWVLSLAQALQNKKTKVEILTWDNKNPISWSRLDANLDIKKCKAHRYFEYLFSAVFIFLTLMKNKYDMVFINFSNYGESIALNLCQFFGNKQPFSIVLHYPYFEVAHCYDSFIKSGLAKEAKYIIAVSHHVAKEAEPVFERPCEVISHGVEAHLYKPDNVIRNAIRTSLGISQHAFVILTVAALEERKGIQKCLHAMPLVLEKIPNLVYWIIGDGLYRKTLENLARELGISSNMRFFGAFADVASYYKSADLFMLLSQGEASSLVLMEAMASELPVIGSNHPPFDELINPSWGCRVNGEDAKVVSDTIFDLYNKPRLRQDMGKAGRQFILKNHTWDKAAEAYLNLIKTGCRV